METPAKYNFENYHIFTECVNCAEICVNAVISFYRFHPDFPITIYLANNDIQYLLEKLAPHLRRELETELIKLVVLPDNIYEFYKRGGHLGTAIIWKLAIEQNHDKKIVHFDGDVIFRGNAVEDIVAGLAEHDLVGPVRTYKCNLNGRNDIRYLPDVASTYCFGFNAKKVSIFEPQIFVNMIRGVYNPLEFPVLDFFDPVSFNILMTNSGTFKIMDFDDFGGLRTDGSRENCYALANKNHDCGRKIFHFSSVGSGLSYSKEIANNNVVNVPQSYMNHAFRTLETYKYLLFGKVPETPLFDLELYKSIREQFLELFGDNYFVDF